MQKLVANVIKQAAEKESSDIVIIDSTQMVCI